MKKSFNEIQSEKEELNEYGYPIHKESDYKKRPEMDFGTWVGLILVFIVMIVGILKLVGKYDSLPLTKVPAGGGICVLSG